MSITCSIPGCYARNSLSEETKLYRVPAVAVGASSLIMDLTAKRRQKWFAALKDCGLTEDNSSSYRVCSNHFENGKPCPLFDSKNNDWSPSLKLDLSQAVEVIVKEDDMDDKKAKRGRPRKKERGVGTEYSQKSSKIRSKSVGHSRSTVPSSDENIFESGTENEISEQPFVFVDIQKIKEGTPVSLKENTSKFNRQRSKSVSSTKRSRVRSFGTQTNPNVLPPLHWGKSRSKKDRDPRFQTASVQTDPISKYKLAISGDDHVQMCVGEIIEFIRKQMLEFNLKALGNNFTLKECSLHFQKEGEIMNPKDKDSSSVVVHANRLLSSNWPLLESLAMSLDLYRLQKRNDAMPTGFVQKVFGRTENIEQTKDVSTKNALGKIKRNKVKVQDKMTLPDNVTNDDGHSEITVDLSQSPTPNSVEKPILSPVIPKITNVVSLGDLMKNSISPRKSLKQSSSNKKFAKVLVPSPNSVPTVTRLTPKNASAARRQIDSTIEKSRHKPIILTKKMPSEENVEIQGILGTTKVPRVFLPKLPDSIVQNVLKDGTVSVASIGPLLEDGGTKNTTIAAPKCSVPLILVPGVPINAQTTSTNEITNSSVSFQSVKNVPVKLPQSQGVAGYLLLPNNSSPGAPIMYVPKVAATEQTGGSSGGTKISFEELLKKGLPGVQTLMLQEGTKRTDGDEEQKAGSDATQVVSPQMVLGGQPAKVLKAVKGKVAIPRWPKKKATTENTVNVVDIKGDPQLASQVDGASLRCPYCLMQCKDGIEFINHHKSTGCRSGKGASNVLVKCGDCKRFYKKTSPHTCEEDESEEAYPDCNVCGSIFARRAYLANHVQTHPEYSIWTEQCSKCPKKFETPEDLEEHFSLWHSIHHPSLAKGQFICGKCSKRFQTNNELDLHVEKTHPSTKKCSIKIRCKFCRDIYELDYYRSVHWKECQENKRNQEGSKLVQENSQEKKRKQEGGKSLQGKSQEKKGKQEGGKLVEYNSEEKKGKQEEVKLVEESNKQTNNEHQEDITKKPTAIRSKLKKDHVDEFDDRLGCSIEKELSKMFQEENSMESSASEYENEELLTEGYENDVEKIEPVKITKKEGTKETRKRRERFMNLDASDTDEDMYSPPLKITKLERKGSIKEEEKIISNNISIEKSEEIPVNIVNKIDFQSLLSTDGGANDIVFEEMDDDEYYS